MVEVYVLKLYLDTDDFIEPEIHLFTSHKKCVLYLRKHYGGVEVDGNFVKVGNYGTAEIKKFKVN